MNYFTSNTNELKRKIVNFSKNMSNGLDKPDSKFLCDMLYGLASGKDIKISNIARQLHEDIKLDNTIERLCLNLNRFDNTDTVNKNYYRFIESMTGDYPISLFDDSDMVKIWGKKFEDLDLVRDASDPNGSLKPGYHICNAVILTKNEMQPAPIYSKIYSTKSKEFKSSNEETFKSIDAVRKCLNKKSLMVFDRAYDDIKLIRYVVNGGDDIIVRLKENRTFLFKDKKKKLEEVYNSRKGKIKMHLTFQGEEKDVYLSYTRAKIPNDNREYTLIFVYGLGKNEKFMLLTNKDIKCGEDAIKLVRIYLYRWRIETYHRSIKTEYKYEDMRVRSLKEINNLNYIFNMLIGLIVNITEEMDNKLLGMKILDEGKSLRKKVGVWITQMAVGIHAILRRAQVGVKSFFKELETEYINFIQLSLEL